MQLIIHHHIALMNSSIVSLCYFVFVAILYIIIDYEKKTFEKNTFSNGIPSIITYRPQQRFILKDLVKLCCLINSVLINRILYDNEDDLLTILFRFRNDTPQSHTFTIA